jgi:glycosyltransferase involved in cell wall biosynthesis
MNITVIIPTKNRPKDLLVAVDSIVNQKSLPNQLVIVDQSESPQSESVVKGLLEKTGIKLTYIYDRSITGLVHAKQVGVSNSIGDIVCFLEDDIELEESYVYEMSNAFEQNPNMMGCCGVVTNLGHLSKYYVYFFHLFHRDIFYDQRVGVHGFTKKIQANLIASRYLSGGTSAFRKIVFDYVLFDLDNNFFMLEDIDFSMRANHTFGDVFYINTKARLAHYMSPVNRAVYQQRYQKKLREFVVFYKKHAHGIKSFIALVWLLIGMLLEALFVSLSNFKLAPIKGYFMGIKDGILWRLRVGAK